MASSKINLTTDIVEISAALPVGVEHQCQVVGPDKLRVATAASRAAAESSDSWFTVLDGRDFRITPTATVKIYAFAPRSGTSLVIAPLSELKL